MSHLTVRLGAAAVKTVVGAVVAGTATIFVSIKTGALDRAGKIEHIEHTDPAPYGMTTAAETPAVLETLAQKPLEVLKMAPMWEAISGNVQGHARLDGWSANGHRYAYYSRLFSVAPALHSAFANIKNNNVFRALLACFAPYGRETAWRPRTDGGKITDAGVKGTLVGVPTYPGLSAPAQEVATERWTKNQPVSGPIALGNHASIFAKHYHSVEDDTYVVRYALMQVLAFHTLAGVAMWVMIYNKRTGNVSMTVLGGGVSQIPGVDSTNNSIAGFVFSTMSERFNVAQRLAAGRTTAQPLLTDTGAPAVTLGSFMDEVDAEIERTDPGLHHNLWLGSGLDALAAFTSSGRQLATGNDGTPPGPHSGGADDSATVVVTYEKD